MNKTKKYMSRMAKTFFFITFAMLMLASCSDYSIREDIELVKDKTSLNLKLTVNGNDNTGEKRIENLRMIAFANNGSLIYNGLIVNNGSAITSPFVFPITVAQAGEDCIFYFIANAEERSDNPQIIGDLSSQTITEAGLKTVVQSYNSLLNLPLVMTARHVQKINKGTTNDLGTIHMKYACTKVHFYFPVKVTDHPALKINSLAFKHLSEESMLVDPTTRDKNNIFDTNPISLTVRSEDSTDIKDNTTKYKIFEGVYYIPEAYAYPQDHIDNNKLTQLVINYDSKGVSNKEKLVNLIGKKGETTPSKTTPRATEYVVKPKVLDDDLVINVEIKDWATDTVCVSIGQYTLKLSTTNLDVSSIGELTYSSNAPLVKFEWDTTKIKHVPPAYEPNKDHTLKFEYIGTETTDSSVIWAVIKDEFGNELLRKRIDVKYSFVPYLEVEKEIVINFGDVPVDNPKKSEYKTNLETVKLINNGSSVDSYITPNGHKVSIITGGASESGYIQVEAKEVSAYEEFMVEVKATGAAGTRTEFVKVIIIPKGNAKSYKIYFRAINDPIAKNGNELRRWGNCHIYLYDDVLQTPISDDFKWPGKRMEPVMLPEDEGWFLIEIPDTDPEYNKIKYGNIRMIFQDTSDDYYFPGGNFNHLSYKVQQRFPQHREPGINSNIPGIPIFNFADQEGWFVYDPSVDKSALDFYDSKPDIKDIEYTLYFKLPKWFWYEGVKADNSNANESYDSDKGYPRLWLFREYGEKGYVDRQSWEGYDLRKPQTYSPITSDPRKQKFWWDPNPDYRYWNDDASKLERVKYTDNDSKVVLKKTVKMKATPRNHIKHMSFSVQKNRNTDWNNGDNKYWHRYPTFQDYFLEDRIKEPPMVMWDAPAGWGPTSNNWDNDWNIWNDFFSNKYNSNNYREANKYYIFNWDPKTILQNDETDTKTSYEGWLEINLGTPPNSNNMKWILTNPNW